MVPELCEELHRVPQVYLAENGSSSFLPSRVTTANATSNSEAMRLFIG